MLTSVTPSTLLLRQIDNFLGLLPAVRDGSTEGIHDARVATRRMRELLPLLAAQLSPSELERIDSMLRKVTRRLGRARDLDVQDELLASLEPALPGATEEIGTLRHDWRIQRDRRVRRAIKSLERLDAEKVLRELQQTLRDHPPALFALRRRASAALQWEALLASQLRERGGQVADAVARTGGVLFPNRLHATRVSLKKLRYAMEIATATGKSDFQPALRALRKSQEVLGRLHDLDVLAATVSGTRRGAERVLPLIEHQRRHLHERYLRRRDDILTTCGDAATAASRDHRAVMVRRTALLASVPLAMLAIPLTRRRRSA